MRPEHAQGAQVMSVPTKSDSSALSLPGVQRKNTGGAGDGLAPAPARVPAAPVRVPAPPVPAPAAPASAPAEDWRFEGAAAEGWRFERLTLGGVASCMMFVDGTAGANTATGGAPPPPPLVPLVLLVLVPLVVLALVAVEVVVETGGGGVVGKV